MVCLYNMLQLEVMEGIIIDLYGFENYVVVVKDLIYVFKFVIFLIYFMISSKCIEYF